MARPPSWMNCAALLTTASHVVMALQTPSVIVVPRSSTISSSSLVRSTSTPDFTGSFDSHQMDALVQRGELEASLMQASVGELEERTKKISKKKKKKQEKKSPSIAMSARTLREDGVVRLNGVLSSTSAAILREEILECRTAAYAAISGGDDEWRKYFADVLLKENRCDLLLPLKGSRGIQTALHELLVSSNLSNILVTALGGDDATLYELAALISEPGSPRQPVHPDNPHQEHPPLLTVFVALQDITSQMGPTSFIPNTHTAAAHAKFDDISQRDAFLQNSSSVVALLKSGDASLFDSRTMHCGGANDGLEGATRVLLYASFRNPRATEPIGNVGSMMKGVKCMTLRELKTKLAAGAAALSRQDNDDGKHMSFDPFDDDREEEDAIRQNRLAAEQGNALAQLKLGTNYYLGEGGVETNHVEAVHWFELAAAQGLAHAQFNLGFCYSTGVVGVLSQQDLERAMELFHLAAEQGHQGAKEAYVQASSECEKMQAQ